MDRRRADLPAVAQRLLDGPPEILLPARNGPKTRFSRISGHRVEAEHGEAVARECGTHLGGRGRIGPVHLDGREARRCGGIDAFEVGPIREEKTQIGGEPRHGHGCPSEE
jgi:hypothetical protein